MSQPPYMTSRSPPPLQHPKPTHPAYPPPEPPRTPSQSTNSSPYSQAQRISQDGYMRYSSPPVAESSAPAPNLHGYTAPQARAGYAAASPNPAVGYGGMGSMGAMGQPQPGQGGPGYAGWGGMNDATAQMGVQFGKSAVAAGQEYVEKNVNWTCALLLTTVYAVPSAHADQDCLLSHQHVCAEEAPASALPMAAQALGQASPPVGRRRGRGLASAQRRYQRAGSVHPK